MSPTDPLLSEAGPTAARRRLRDCLPDLAAFAGALLTAGLAALLLGSLPGCGGGVGGEGTGSFASSYASGTISGFGSIIVNGVHFDESNAAVADDDGAGLDRGALALGMVVQVSGGAISTAADGTQVATASTVRINRALVGPAGTVDGAAGRLTVLGQTVLVSVDTVFDDRLVGGLAGVATGQVLAVYGYYNATAAAYAATRIAPASAAASYRVSGPVASVDGSQQFKLGSQTYAGATAGLAPGAQVRLNVQPAPDRSGHWVVNNQRADDTPPTDRDGAGLDGVVSALQPGSRFTVNGVTVDASAARISGMLQVGARVELRGTLRAGVLVASEVKVAADEARLFELKGTISQLDTVNRRFMLRSTPVAYGRADLVFKNGNAAQLIGYTGTLKVQGVLSADRTRLDATLITFKN